MLDLFAFFKWRFMVRFSKFRFEHFYRDTDRRVVFKFHEAPYGLRGSNVPWFMCWFWCYINCLFVCLLNFFPFFYFYTFLFHFFTLLFIYFHTCLHLTYLSTPSRIDLFSFQARGCRRRPNLAFRLLGSFYVVVYFVGDACSLLCVVLVLQY